MWTSSINTYLRFFLVCTILALLGALTHIHTLQTIPYSALSHISSLGLLVTSQPSIEETKTTVYRLQDGIPQEIPGNWQHTFTHLNEIFFYGFPKEQPNNQAVIALNDRGANIKNASGLLGPITTIAPSPDSVYLMISGTNSTDNMPYTCIALRRDKDYSTCKNVFGDILTQDKFSPEFSYISFWNPKETAQLYILENSPAHKAFVYTPTQKTAEVTEITEEGRKEIILSDLNKRLTTAGINDETLSTFGPIVYRKNEKTNTYRFFIEFGKKKFLTLSDQHALLIKDDGLWVIDSIEKQKALLAPIQDGNTILLDYFSHVSP